jgi:phosphotransferase system  glucose/maltose/N-acetylglucosamine-specific IIC component
MITDGYMFVFMISRYKLVFITHMIMSGYKLVIISMVSVAEEPTCSEVEYLKYIEIFKK